MPISKRHLKRRSKLKTLTTLKTKRTLAQWLNKTSETVGARKITVFTVKQRKFKKPLFPFGKIQRVYISKNKYINLRVMHFNKTQNANILTNLKPFNLIEHHNNKYVD